jgi:hypothetical protein
MEDLIHGMGDIQNGNGELAGHSRNERQNLIFAIRVQ